MTITLNGEETGAEQAGTAAPKSEVATIDRRFVGLIKADRAEIRSAAVGAVLAQKDVSIDRAGLRAIVAGGSIRMSQGAAGTILAGGATSIRQGGAGTIFSLGPTQIEQGGAGTLIAGSATVGKGGVVLLAVTPRLEVEEGGRVFGGPVAAVAAAIGVAIGFALGALVLRQRRS
ncbi:MAG TPA: hypothetical protein VI056_01095 [Candidatus Limnocylindria bacterium]